MENVDARQKAFEDEMLPHMSALLYFALSKTSNIMDAEDLLQDTFMNAYRYLDKFMSGTNAKGWLLRIMTNSFINRYRKRLKEPDQVNYEDEEKQYAFLNSRSSEDSDLQQEMLESQLGDEIADALDHLPDDYRTVTILSDIEGYTYEEIADFLEIPIGTVRSRLHRARKILRSILKEYAMDHGYAADDSETELVCVARTKDRR